MASELDKITDFLRQGTVDLAYLNRPATDTQIQAMVDVCLLHHHASEDISDIGNCDCGWSMKIHGQPFEDIERAFLAHIMADIVERVFKKSLLR